LYVSDDQYPVVLVHGWKSHPGVWKRLISRLEEQDLPCWTFDHAVMSGACTSEIAEALQDYIAEQRERSGYAGPVDLVCHCMGTCIARYMLEVMNSHTMEGEIRQLIGLGPPNNGSSIAELFNDSGMGDDIIHKLHGVFVQPGFNPAEDVIVQEFRPGSSMMRELASAGIRKDIPYRILLTANHTETPDFFHWFNGKTWVFSPESGWKQTYQGDGIVPHSDSFLPGAGLDILPADPRTLEDNPEQYCHFMLPKNEEIIQRVIDYLTDPQAQPHGYCPSPVAER
jgi:triacylglycerol lipase